jgi:hypothetical protein
MNLDQLACNILTVVMSFGFYKCMILPMGVMPATEFFQSRLVSIFADMGPDKPILTSSSLSFLQGNVQRASCNLGGNSQRLGNDGFQVNMD